MEGDNPTENNPEDQNQEIGTGEAGEEGVNDEHG